MFPPLRAWALPWLYFLLMAPAPALLPASISFDTPPTAPATSVPEAIAFSPAFTKASGIFFSPIFKGQ